METALTGETSRRPGMHGQCAATCLLTALVVWAAQPGRADGALSLAESLATEGQWALARAECHRVLLDAPDAATAGRARLLAARAQAQIPDAAALPTFEALWRDGDLDREIRCAAAGEWGRLQAAKAPRAACEALCFAYFQTREVATFHQAGRDLFALLRKNGALRRDQPLAWLTLQSCRDAWPADRTEEASRPPRRASWLAFPGRLIGGFYRRQIGPAIGMRCELHPSCSAYLLEACQVHGLLGFSLLADRLVREPSVAAAREETVTLPDGRVRTADPLHAHDFWMGDPP
jgi:hypothetical protein